MGKDWDKDKGGRDRWIAWMTEVFTECLRVCCAGAHALVWSLPRTSHWTATALEDAGWEVRDCVTHLYSPNAELTTFMQSLSEQQRDALYRVVQSQEPTVVQQIFGSGFPKSTSIEKQIDRELGKSAEREVVGYKLHARDGDVSHQAWTKQDTMQNTVGNWGYARDESKMLKTAPATPQAAQWQGFGSALKPSTEFWWLVRKPLSEKNLAANVLQWGTGGLAIDKCRVTNPGPHGTEGRKKLVFDHEEEDTFLNALGTVKSPPNPSGRWPSHLLLSHSPWCQLRGMRKVRYAGGPRKAGDDHKSHLFPMGQTVEDTTRLAEDGLEEIPDFVCHPSCPVAELSRQAGESRSNARQNKKPTGYTSAYFGVKANNEGWTGGENDEGSKARYFTQFHDPLDTLEAPFHYFSKSSRAERSKGCEGLSLQSSARISGVGGPKVTRCPTHDTSFVSGAIHYTCGCPFIYEGGSYDRLNAIHNSHPTVKSLALCRWLCRLICPPGGIVLDPFLGSGSTAVAAIQEKLHFIGIEESEEYCEIARARIAHAMQQAVPIIAPSSHLPSIPIPISKRRHQKTPSNANQPQLWDMCEEEVTA